MRISLFLGLLLVGCGRVEVTSTTNIAGIYQGVPTATTQIGVLPGALILRLAQAGNVVSGSYTDGGLQGTIAGTVAGDTAAVTFTDTNGTLTGSLSAAGTALTLNVAGSLTTYGSTTVKGTVTKQ